MYDDNATANRFGESLKILFRWRGSIYRLIWEPFLIYLITYVIITVVYDYALGEIARREFVIIANYCTKYTSAMPVVLLLGFFTSTAMTRWFSIMTAIPGTGKVIGVFMLTLKENLPDGSQLVQQYARWTLLGWALIFRTVCPPMRKAYPDLISLQNAGFLLQHERLALEREEKKNNGEHLPLIVFEWKLALLRRCNRLSHFNLQADYNRNVDALMVFKKSCGNTLKFANKNIPFALIQVVSITVYSVGVASLMARVGTNLTQDADKSVIFGYMPILNSFQYFLYFSWLKFGAMAANPFGEDEDDINVKQILQTHIEDAMRLQDLYDTSCATESLVGASIETSTKENTRLQDIHAANAVEEKDSPNDIVEIVSDPLLQSDGNQAVSVL